MAGIIDGIGRALLTAAGMAWQTGWSLVLGFAISALVQATVPASRVRDLLGRSGPREIALASAAGAASSSCSYASAAIMRTMFKKGAALAPSLAFLFASTNLVLELGIVLWLLLGWRFMLAEWIGGIVLIAIMSLIVRLTATDRLVERARAHEETGRGHQHEAMTAEGATWRERLADPRTPARVAQNFAMDWSMLWKDLAAGFLIGGALAVFVPDNAWQALFLHDAPEWLRTVGGVLIGPIVAMLSFVCSIGNVPLAAVLWGGGASFGGVLAFLYADLVILPLLDAYRRYFGWRMAGYIAALFLATMASSALIVDLGFSAAGLTPARTANVVAHVDHFAVNYTFWLNLAAIALAIWLFAMARRHPMAHDCHKGGTGE